MAVIKIFENNGIEIENIDGAALNHFTAGGRDCILKSVLNECKVFSPNSMSVAVSTGEMIIQGVRIKILENVTYTFPALPSSSTPELYRVVAILTKNATLNGYVYTAVFSHLPKTTESLRKDDFFKNENASGRYEVEVANYYISRSGISNINMTMPVVYGGIDENALNEKIEDEVEKQIGNLDISTGGSSSGSNLKVIEKTLSALNESLIIRINKEEAEECFKGKAVLVVVHENDNGQTLYRFNDVKKETYNSNNSIRYYFSANQASFNVFFESNVAENVYVDAYFSTQNVLYNLFPSSNDTYSLGEVLKRWKNAYINNIFTRSIFNEQGTIELDLPEKSGIFATQEWVRETSDNKYVNKVDNVGVVKELTESINGLAGNVEEINNILEERFDDVNLPNATQFTPDIIFGENGSVYVKTSSYNVELKDDGTLEVVSSTPETGRYVEILNEYENIPITSLAENSFANNSVLYGIELNKNITKLGSRAFYNCVGLLKLVLNASITQIGNEVFANCTNLEDVEIGESVAVLGNKMFANCSNLKNITLPELITEIPNLAFSFTGLTEIVIPKNVAKIGQQAFINCRDLISVTIGDSVTSIGYGAFSSCSSLTSIVIPNSVTSIGNSAFSYCSSLTEIVIPNRVTEISSSTFEGCSSLTEIVIPNSVTKIGEEAISFCNNLTNLTIPDSVTSIGGYAFQGCVNLTSVTIGNSVTSIGPYAFSGCSSLTSAKINEGVSLISQGLFFYCSNLQEVTIPSSVNEISVYAFEHCSNLKNIRIRATIPPLGGNHSSFNGISRDAIFRVPKGTLSRYQSSWSSLYNTYTFVEAND